MNSLRMWHVVCIKHCAKTRQTSTYRLYKHVLHQHHIAGCAAKDAEQVISPPDVERRYHRDGDELGGKTAECVKGGVLQTVDDQNGDDCQGQQITQPFDHFGRFSFAAEDDKGKQSGSEGKHSHQQDDDQSVSYS